jgi:predicted nucleic acid-binding protein
VTDYVVDASVVIKWFVPEILEAEAKRWIDPSFVLFAPDLLPSEFGNILWKKGSPERVNRGGRQAHRQ